MLDGNIVNFKTAGKSINYLNLLGVQILSEFIYF